MAFCGHLDQIRDVQPSTTEGCTDCLRMGGRWVHLRAEGHPLIRSAEARRIAEDSGLQYVEARCMGKLAAYYGITKTRQVAST